MTLEGVVGEGLSSPAAASRRVRGLGRSPKVCIADCYPTFLMAHLQVGISLSLAHKRWAQNEAGKTVLDGDVLEANLHSPGRPDLIQQFVDALPLEKQPTLSLHALYQGWMDTLTALQTAFVTGVFAVPSSREQAAERHRALQEVKRLRVEIARLKAVATKEKQMAR